MRHASAFRGGRKCRECIRTYHTEWRKKNYVRWRERARVSDKRYRQSPKGAAKRREYQRSFRHGYNIRTKYGLDTETFALMLQAQAHSCPICSREFSDKLLPCVDHNHETGAVRGLLCRTCNAAIGGLQDSSRLLLVAAKYLESYGN